jgi:gamma-glutamylcyclotransferase (GGCT)/AIG2-like uncharacterized protein YtfP
VEQQLAVKIPDESFPAMTEKIVRGIVYREDGAVIEAPGEIECFLGEEQRAKEVRELLDKHGKVFERESRAWRYVAQSWTAATSTRLPFGTSSRRTRPSRKKLLTSPP